MPPASQTEHKTVANTALPYISNSSLINTDPHFISGTQNVLTGLRQWAENRPGFSLTIAGGWQHLVRHFVWQRWTGSSPNGGAFIHMFCDIQAAATVYKMQIGLDASPVKIFTSSVVNPFDFVVSNNTCYFGNGVEMKKFDSSTVTNWGIVSPTVGPTIALVSGSLNAYTSKCYLYTFWNANTQHESSPSDISACSGVFTGKYVNVGVTASPDPQVTNIRVYTTPDGGAQEPTEMQEIIYVGGIMPANVTGNVQDQTLDVNLSIRVAPEFLRNDPPPPSQGFVPYAGRIWGFQNNTTFYSGFEEIQNGVPEECWPSGLDGNNYPWDKEVFAHAPLIDGISVFAAGRIYKIEGDTLDTFRRYTLLERRGTRNRTTVASLGGSVAWFDTSGTVWISDLGEISEPIRPDLALVNPSTAYLTIHISGIYHWLVLLDGTRGLLFVYDLDTSQWLPPWSVGTSGSALASYEIAVGSVQLMFARNKTKSLQLVPATYADDGQTYGSTIKTNMYRLTPDGNPSFQGVHAWSEIKTDTGVPNKVLQLTDDDPTTASYRDITANGEPSPNIAQGGNLLTTRWTAYDQTAQLLGMQYIWNASGANWHLYQLDESFYPFGG